MKFVITFTHDEKGAGQRVPGWEQLTPAELGHLRLEHDDFESILQREKGARITYLESPSEAKTVCLNAGGRVEVDSTTMVTGNPRVFAGGDAVNGGMEVVNAVHDGQLAARSIDAMLRRGELHA